MLNEKAIQTNHKICLDLLDKFVEVCEKNKINYYLAFGTCLGAVRHKGFIPWDINIDILMTLKEFEKLDKAMNNENLKDMRWCCPENGSRIFPLLMHKDSWNYETKPNVDVSVYVNAPNNSFIRNMLRILAYLNIKMYKLKNTNVNRIFPYNILKIIATLLPNAFYIGFVRILEKIGNLSKFKHSKYKMVLLPSVWENREELKSEWFGEKTIISNFEGRQLPILKGFHEYLTMRYGDYMKPKKWNDKGEYKYAK